MKYIKWIYREIPITKCSWWKKPLCANWKLKPSSKHTANVQWHRYFSPSSLILDMPRYSTKRWITRAETTSKAGHKSRERHQRIGRPWRSESMRICTWTNVKCDNSNVDKSFPNNSNNVCVCVFAALCSLVCIHYWSYSWAHAHTRHRITGYTILILLNYFA